MSTIAHSEAGIEQLLHAENELLPPKSLVENARLKDYAAEYKRSVEDPEAFWADVANELEWFQPRTKVFDLKYTIFYCRVRLGGLLSLLACPPIGPVHSVLYAGFSVGALPSRIEDAQARVILT